MSLQLPLGISLSESFSFDNFLPGDNAVGYGLSRSLAALSGERQVLLWGEASVGKTHLLQASCAAAATAGVAVSYLPLAEVLGYGPEMLEGLEQLQLICLDDVHVLAGRRDWEVALFNLINAARSRDARLLLAASGTPLELGIELPDLVSRLGWGPVVQLLPLSDEGKLDWLRLRAERRGLQMPAEVAAYLLRHCPRDMAHLGEVLDKLDRASLVAQRRLTVPFVKDVIEL